jgi:hypothetical protein
MPRRYSIYTSPLGHLVQLLGQSNRHYSMIPWDLTAILAEYSISSGDSG